MDFEIGAYETVFYKLSFKIKQNYLGASLYLCSFIATFPTTVFSIVAASSALEFSIL